MGEQVVLESFLCEIEKIAARSSGPSLFSSYITRAGKKLMGGRSRVEETLLPKGKVVRRLKPKEGADLEDMIAFYTGKATHGVGKRLGKAERFVRKNPGATAGIAAGGVGTGMLISSALGDR